MGAQSPHSLRLSPDALPSNLVQPISFDEREGDVAIEQPIVGTIDALLPALAQELQNLVATLAEGGGLDCWGGLRGVCRQHQCAGGLRSAGRIEVGASIGIIWVEGERGLRVLSDRGPV